MSSIDPYALLDALLRRRFRAFVHKVFVTLHGREAAFVEAWHLDAICHQVEEVLAGRCQRLIINLPPRCLKSMVVSVALPALLLGLRPHERILCVSYGDDLAREHARLFRRVVESEWYRRVFPHMRIDPRKNTEAMVATTAGGFRLATSVGGALTGRGGTMIIIDDPMKADDAASASERQRVIRWYGSTLLSRLDNPAFSPIVVVMQRLHAEDLTGHLLEQGGWRHLRLPAICDEDQIIELGDGRVRLYRKGELLDEVRLPHRILAERRAMLGAFLFDAQYQQRPSPPDGSIIHRAWLRGFDRRSLVYRPSQVIQSWDIANKPGFGNDYCCCVTAVDIGGRLYIIDRERFQAEFPELRRHLLASAKRHGANVVLIEDAGSGTGLIQDLRDSRLNIIAVRPERDKQSRAIHAGATLEAGNVLFDQSADWYPELERELLEFPQGRHDDQVDALTQLILWWRERGGPRVWPTDLCQPDADDEIYGEEGYMPPFFLNLPRRD